MSAEHEMVKSRPEHKLPIAELQRQLWSSDTRLNTRYFEWKYEGNPRLREPAVYLALHRGKPVGMRGFHEARLEAGTPTRTFPVLVAGDALIDSAHRDRGLVTRIMKLAYADLAGHDYTHLVSFGGANRINALGLMGLGWKSTGGLQPVGRVSIRATRSMRLRSIVSRLPVFWRISEARFLHSAEQRNPFRRLDAAIDAAQGKGAPITIAREP